TVDGSEQYARETRNCSGECETQQLVTVRIQAERACALFVPADRLQHAPERRARECEHQEIDRSECRETEIVKCKAALELEESAAKQGNFRLHIDISAIRSGRDFSVVK